MVSTTLRTIHRYRIKVVKSPPSIYYLSNGIIWALLKKTSTPKKAPYFHFLNKILNWFNVLQGSTTFPTNCTLYCKGVQKE